jgi:hypothetical protein
MTDPRNRRRKRVAHDTVQEVNHSPSFFELKVDAGLGGWRSQSYSPPRQQYIEHIDRGVWEDAGGCSKTPR